MKPTLFFFLAIVCIVVESTTLYVRNECSSAQPVVFRGAYGKIYYEGSIPSKGVYSVGVDESNCESCNIGVSTGATLLAEFSLKGGTTWWDLSTDAGYTNPPFAMYTSDPSSPYMFCGDPRCPDGTPGDSHINNCPEQFNIFVVYCGNATRA